MPTYRLTYDSAATPLPHFWEHTVGSGHAPLTLRADWQRHMRRAHDELGFQHVRFHGILSKPMDTLTRPQEEMQYSFWDAIQITDFIHSLGMHPFMELSYMPEPLASGDETVFHYNSNITPPNDYREWAKLIRRLVRQWEERYGADEVRRWYFEVWNEPNFPQQWAGDQDDYFCLYRHTVEAIKGVDAALRVGGPASAKNGWIPDLLEFCEKNGLPIDFVSTHHYPEDVRAEVDEPIEEKLSKIERGILTKQTRQARAEAGAKPLYYTEWNSSGDLTDELHDQSYTAAFAVKTIMDAAGLVDGYAFWTLTDVFREVPMRSTPFHGGFGLLNLHGIPKPVYHAYRLLHTVGTETIPVEGEHETVDVWAVRGEQRLDLVLTNHAMPRSDIRTELVRWRVEDTPVPTQVRIARVDQEHGNPRALWVAMGSPEFPSREQVGEIEAGSAVNDEPLAWTIQDGAVELAFDMPPHSVAVVSLDFSNGAKPSGLGRTGERTNHYGRRGIASDSEFLDTLARATMIFFNKERGEATGLLPDSTKEDSSCSVMSVAMALPVYIVAVERDLLSRDVAAERIRRLLRMFWHGEQSPHNVAMGYKGFFYHFLDMANGLRVKASELTTIDTAFFIGGALVASMYFDRDTPVEREIRDLADQLYRRVDWEWAQNGGPLVTMGWKPEEGFDEFRWEGYSEALLLYVLALASPTHPIKPEAYDAWLETYEWKNVHGFEYVHAGPLFIHQFSQAWIDFRGIQDRYMREKGIDYFENTRRATLAQQAYAIANPNGFRDYGEFAWGITASSGPGNEYRMIGDQIRRFHEYEARGIPDGPDDGTLSPWAAAASLPFAPEIVLPTLRHFHDAYPEATNLEGFLNSFNPTYPENNAGRAGWVSPDYFGLDQGPVIMMIQNYEDGLIWRLMQRCPYIVQGLLKAGFTGGWLSGANPVSK